MSNDNIKVYKVELEAHNVTPAQRELIYSSLDKAFDAILKSDLTGEDQYISLGETKVSEDFPLKADEPFPFQEVSGLV